MTQPEMSNTVVLPPASPSEQADSTLPAIQTRFKIIGQRSAGRDGVAYDADDSINGQRVLLCRVGPAMGHPQRGRQLAARLRLVELLDHAASRPIRLMSLEGGSPLVVLDLCDGQTLATVLCRPEPLMPVATLRIAHAIASGISAAHRLNLCHGALGLDTVHVTDCRVQLDFTGLQVGLHSPTAESQPSVPPDTPELASDVFQLGQLLDRLLGIENIALWLSELSARHAAGLKQRIREAMSDDVARRPLASDIAELLSALLDAAQQRPAVTPDMTVVTDVTSPPANDSTTEIELQLPAGNDATDGTLETEVESELLETVRQLRKPLASGDRLGRYEIAKKLGEGGMGAVYQATDIGDQTTVAIKVLGAAAARKSNAVRRFQKEARLLAAVNNPYVTNLIEFNEDEGAHYIVLEFVDGTDLKRMLAKHSQLPEETALGIAADVARALIDAHQRGIVHRDIKPENILLTELSSGNGAADASLRVKLSDFGIARFIDQSESLAVTQAGSVIGTPLYMSPEQCKGQGEVTPQSDVYALGVTLFEMLAGRPPFVADDPMKLAAMHCFDAPPCLRKLNAHVSEAVASIVTKALAKRPEDRWADAAHLLRELDRHLRGEPANIDVHPLLPEHDPARLFEAEFQWELESTPEELWPYVSNTERLNRAIGLPAVEYRTQVDPERGVRKFGSFRLAGVIVSWEEHPFEWIEARRMGVLRQFDRGPFDWFLSMVDLERLPDGGTRLRHSVRIAPRNLMGRLLAKIEAGWKAQRSLDRVYRRIDDTLVGNRTNATHEDAFEKPHALSGSHRRRLVGRLERLIDRGVDSQLASQLGEYISTAPAQEVAKIRPIALADRFAASQDAVIDACLLAAGEGLLTLGWDILCPTCRVAADTKSTLKELQGHTFCEACHVDFASDLANSIELVFRPAADLRETNIGKFCIGGPANSPHVVAQVRLAPQERIELELSLPSGEYLLRGPQLPKSLTVHVQSSHAPSQCEIVLDEQLNPRFSPTLRAGKQVISVTNDHAQLQVVRLERTLSRQDLVTAAAASALPMFRELFPKEVFDSGGLVSAEQVALMVTGIDNIDQVYAQHSDADAYALIRKHLELLESEVRRRRGAVVKTQGEGLVAAFDDAADAVATAMNLQRVIDDCEDTTSLRLNVGVHRGPALVANVNDRLDYFGATSRVAAALPTLGKGGVVLTEMTYGDPVVADLLAGLTCQGTIQQIDLPGSPGQFIQTFAFATKEND